MFLGSDDEDRKEKVKIAAKTEITKEPSRVATDSALNFISLPAFGGIFQNVAYETIKRIKYPNMQHRLQDVRTGNIFADLTLDVTGLVADTGVMTKYFITGEKFKSGPSEGKLKWKRSAKQVADQLAELIAIRRGLPYSAPKGEIYYQAKSAESAVKRAKTAKELEALIKKYTYKKSNRREGRVRGRPHKGKEEQVTEWRSTLEKLKKAKA